jgi:nucleoside-diphosphate-sugar epimerase
MILVTGGAGVVGSRLVKKLADRGNKVRVLALPGDPAIDNLRDIDCEVFVGDVADPSTLAQVCNSVETVYHLAAIIITNDPARYRTVNVNGTRNMLNCALATGVKHFILVSSAAALDPASSPYAVSKKEAEAILLAQDKMQTTIVRPTLIYEQGGGQEFMMFWNYLQKYPVIPFVGRGQAMKNPVYAEDLIAGLVEIAGNEKTFGKMYHFSGGQEIPMIDLVRLMLRHQGSKKPIICVPLFLCRLLAWFFGRVSKKPPLTAYSISRIEAEANPDNTEASNDLGYNPIPVSRGLQICYPIPEQ